ncbi:MAG: type II toxin-antitoxin system RelE/ParE family toxin [Bacteroidota bacterium]
MRFSFHPAAVTEFNEAVEYYEECLSGIGIQFAEEVYATIARIIEYPEAWSPLSKNTRRCLTNRFPFGIVYQLDSDRISIIAVSHLHRRPGYWKGR